MMAQCFVMSSIINTSLCNIFFQICLLEECGLLERALDELHKKEHKIVSVVIGSIV